MANPEQIAILRQGPEVWNAWRKKNPNLELDLSHADLSKVDLRMADLSGADLSFADLAGANLFLADLYESNLSGASLVRATLNSADLKDANFSNTDLTGSKLSDVKLSDVNFSGANLYGADLSRATIDTALLAGANMQAIELENTIFANVDLSTVTGLESANHSGPSTIGVDTLFLSKGKIAETFLRGAGVPDSLITYAKSLAGSAIDFYSCFISYSHADKPFARRLHDTLQCRGIRCWLDERQLLPGDLLYDHVDRGIRSSDKFLLCCSAHSLQPSSWVHKEILTVFEKEDELTKQRGRKISILIPLNLDGYIFGDSWESGYRSQIRSRLAADFTNWERDNAKFMAETEKVISALRADESAREQPPRPRL